jgi:hypothetical protein
MTKSSWLMRNRTDNTDTNYFLLFKNITFFYKKKIFSKNTGAEAAMFRCPVMCN